RRRLRALPATQDRRAVRDEQHRDRPGLRIPLPGPRVSLPLRVRLTAAYALLLVLVLGGSGVLIYARFRADRDGAIEAGLRARRDSVVAAMRNGARPASVEALLGNSDEQFGEVLDGHDR